LVGSEALRQCRRPVGAHRTPDVGCIEVERLCHLDSNTAPIAGVWHATREPGPLEAGRGVDVSEVQDFPWGRFVFFEDPDGNSWAVQQTGQSD
jgi:hypothetical protein